MRTAPELAHNVPTLGGKPGSSSIPSVTRNPPDLGLLEVRRALQRPSMGFEPHGAHGSQAARVGSRPVGRVVLGCTCGGGAAPRGPPFPCASAGAAAGSDPRSYPRTFGRAERLWRRVRRCGQVDVLGHRGRPRGDPQDLQGCVPPFVVCAHGPLSNRLNAAVSLSPARGWPGAGKGRPCRGTSSPPAPRRTLSKHACFER
jgi:hypothetical protein